MKSRTAGRPHPSRGPRARCRGPRRGTGRRPAARSAAWGRAPRPEGSRGPDCEAPRPRPLTEAPPGPANLGSLRRLPRLLGGVRKERLAAHAHPQQRDARVQSPGPVLPHHLHHRRDRRHRGRRRPGHLVHHLVRSAARSVGGAPGALLAPRGGSGARGAGVSAQMPPGPLKGGCRLPAEMLGGEPRSPGRGSPVPWERPGQGGGCARRGRPRRAACRGRCPGCRGRGGTCRHVL